MTWTIDLPWRGDPEQPLLEAMTDTRVIEDREQRAVAYELMFDAYVSDHAETLGEVVDNLERAEPAERRRMLDKARLAAGLETTSDVEAHKRFLTANELAGRPKRVSDEPLRFIPGGSIVPPPDPGELEREQRRDRERAEQLRERQEQREREAEAIRQAAERFQEQSRGNAYWDPPIAGVPTSQTRVQR